MRLIRVLGADSPACRKLTENVRRAVAELAIEAEVERVTDMDVITSYSAMMTPALVIDGQLKTAGRVVPAAEVKTLLAGRD
jgi:small redox-active disulfide protein 2